MIPHDVEAELLPALTSYLGARHGNRLLSQRYAIDGWKHVGMVEDEHVRQHAACAANEPPYFGDSLGAAFLYAAGHPPRAEAIMLVA